MEPATPNVLAGLQEEHGPVLHSLLLEHCHFRREPVFNLLRGPATSVISSDFHISPQSLGKRLVIQRPSAEADPPRLMEIGSHYLSYLQVIHWKVLL